MISLDNLKRRVFGIIPEQHHGEIGREFDKFQYEIQRLSEEEDKTGQASLTDKEVQKLNTTNQHGDEGLTVIQYQVIKGKAIENGVTDWTSKVDSSLTYHENIALMERENDGF